MKRKLILLLLSAISGLLIAASWPARGISPLIFIAFIPLLYIADQVYEKRFPALKGLPYFYLAFVIWNFLTTYWIVYASVEGAIMAIFVNAYFMTFIWQIFVRAKKVLGQNRGYFALIVLWLTYEYLHLDWDLSWPWLQIGNVFANSPLLIQWYEYTGSMGGTFWVLIINILIYETYKKYKNKAQYFRSAIFTTCILVIPITFSLIRYYTYKEKVNPVNVVCVQPNIDPWGKFSYITPQYQLHHLVELASSQIDENTDYVIFPETAIPMPLNIDFLDSSPTIDTLKLLIEPYPKLKLITGLSLVKVFQPTDNIPSTASRFGNKGLFIDDYNSAIQIGNGDGYQIYHKSKLVPGPEMFPFAEVLKPLQKSLFGELGGMIGDFGTQKERSVFINEEKNIKAAPVICYESIYGEYVGRYMRNGGNFISISTNDAWWGDTPGYKQLLAYARLRSIECRRSTARAANTGISCFINQRGDIISPTTYLTDAAIKGSINANDKLTLYARHGDYIGRISLLFGLLLLIFIYTKWILGRKKNS